jgi:hypothetical protein
MGELHTRFWWGELRERDLLEDPGIDERIILKWIFRKCDEVRGLDRSGSGQGKVASFCKRGHERSGSVKCGEFLA